MNRWMVGLVVSMGVSCAAAAPPATRPYTARTYDDAVRELRERGFPATMDDLQSPAMPDDKNAATRIRKAAKMIVADDSGPRNSSLEYGPELPYPQKWFELAEQMMVTHEELLKAVRQARSCPRASWNPVMSGRPSAWMQSGMGSLSEVRALSNIVADAALLEHFKGNDAAALEYVRDHIGLADASAARPFMVSHMVTTGIRAQTAGMVLVISTELRIADARRPSGATNGQEATRQQCKEIIASLLDNRRVREEFARMMREERVFAINEMHAQGQLALEHYQAVMPGHLEWYDCLADDLPTAHLAAVKEEPLVKIAATSYDRYLELRPLMIASRTAAAIGVAARMYREDHGQYPHALKDLVPEYLPQVPADPYSPKGEPMLYRAGTRPMVGSVGSDGIDNQAPTPARPNYTMARPKSGEPDDRWVDLTAWRAKAE